MIPFLDLHRQKAHIAADLDRRMAAVLAHGQFILGPEVAELEAALAKRAGVAYCIACANGTDALQIALMGLGVTYGDEVIVPSFSYVATAEAPALLGATPVFVDVDPQTCLIDPDAVARAITPRTRAVIPVSLYGQCPEIASLEAVLAPHGLPMLEDAAQSFGATHHGRASCGLTRIAATSFFPSKPLGCYGDGGALFTNDPDLAEVVRQISRHGQTRRYHHVRLGVNSRLDTLQAAVLLAKLEIFDEEIARRQEVAARYDAALADLPIELPAIRPGNLSAWAQYTVRLNDPGARDAVAEALKSKGVPTAVHYPKPLHRQPAFDVSAQCPVSERLADTVLSLPFDPWMPAEDQMAVAAALREVFAAGC